MDWELLFCVVGMSVVVWDGLTLLERYTTPRRRRMTCDRKEYLDRCLDWEIPDDRESREWRSGLDLEEQAYVTEAERKLCGRAG